MSKGAPMPSPGCDHWIEVEDGRPRAVWLRLSADEVERLRDLLGASYQPTPLRERTFQAWRALSSARLALLFRRSEP